MTGEILDIEELTKVKTSDSERFYSPGQNGNFDVKGTESHSKGS